MNKLWWGGVWLKAGIVRLHSVAVEPPQISVTGVGETIAVSENRKSLKRTLTFLSHTMPELVLITTGNQALFLCHMKCILTWIELKALSVHLAGEHMIGERGNEVDGYHSSTSVSRQDLQHRDFFISALHHINMTNRLLEQQITWTIALLAVLYKNPIFGLNEHLSPM